MATWKELGEVPDSEDDDDLESLGSSSPDQGSRINEDKQLDDATNLETQGNNEGLALEQCADKHKAGLAVGDLEMSPGNVVSLLEANPVPSLHEPAGDDEENLLESTGGLGGGEGVEDILVDEELPEVLQSISKARFTLSPEPEVSSSPLASLNSQDLPSSWSKVNGEDGDGNEEELEQGSSNTPVHLDVPMHQEEVSKSYVQITSPASSQLSVSLVSLSSVMVPKPLAGDSQTNLNKRKVPMSQNDDAFTGFAKRNFRERTGKQLHPYQHEQMAYDRSLRERGIKPIKIVEAEERRLASLSPDSQLLDLQILDSQDGFIVTEDSQDTDHVQETPSSPPKRRTTPIQSPEPDERITSMDSDDDLPAVEDLIHNPKTRMAFTKRPSKTYSTKGKRNPLSALQTAQISSPQSQRPSSIFDVPTSPPVRSSPFPDFDRGQISRTTSTSSGLPTPRHRSNGHGVEAIHSLKTTTGKLSSPPIFVDSDSGSELDGMASVGKGTLHDVSDPEEASEASNSSSGESVEIRRGGKKIRGVLPASHLRLDAKKKKKITPLQTRQSSRSVSPIEAPMRRGVALPTIRRSTQGIPTPSMADMAFLEGFSDDDDENPNMPTPTQRTALSSLFPQSRAGDAEEEDTIDLMLPSQKRHRTTMNGSKKRRKIGHSGQGKQAGFKKQPRITEHLNNPRVLQPIPRKRAVHSRRHGKAVKEKTPPPMLSILDVTDTLVDRSLPLFIRVAARTSRAKEHQGRQTPTKKFIRLANREDTADAQSVLQEWRNGTIRPKNLIKNRGGANYSSAPASGENKNTEQTTLGSPDLRIRPQHARSLGRPVMSRKLMVSHGAQQSMNEFVSHQKAPPNLHHLVPQLELRSHPDSFEKSRVETTRSRPAQLESLTSVQTDLLPVPKFPVAKGSLDLSYRLARKRALLQANVPLRRYIADENVTPPVQANLLNIHNVDTGSPLQSIEPMQSTARHRKRQPRRLDIGAAEYRQPNFPLVLDSLPPATIPQEGISTKLLNLGKYGTSYTTNFDIFPLPPGVFFQDTTFIGSGRLAEGLMDVGRQWCRPAAYGPPSVLSLGVKEFYWGNWNDQVSSEIGICFDWIVEQCFGQSSDDSSRAVPKPVDVLQSVYVYVQSVTFVDAKSLHKFVSRMKGILDDFIGRVDKESKHVDSAKATYVVLMQRCILLCLRLLLMSRSSPELSSLNFEVEALLQIFAISCVKVLLAIGLERVRKLYDNLQYVSIRDHGIGKDDSEIEAWIIVLKVLNKACIPRGSFLDVVNSVLLSSEVKKTQDARTMEKMWYLLFSLLPLSEFDDFGVVIQGSRHAAAFDNWALPQQMLKQVFKLYKSNQRQSPSFNDYCRSIVSRCHFLMVEWGWWKCNGVIGTLFDFFASQNLANLRNEEVHESPHFLEELHLSPSFDIEAEDRCFHIFLKIVALVVKHLGEVDNVKGARNLLARVLPNHDRQYPKDEEILERDLASLRNHHDLLCTLYFATPTQFRPAPTQIQRLVNPYESHSRAILLNIRSWQRLADLVLTEDSDYEAHHSLALWQHALLRDLLSQQDNIETEIRTQATNSSGIFTENDIKATISANKMETSQLLEQLLAALKRVLFPSSRRPTRRLLLSTARTYIGNGGLFDTRPLEFLADCHLVDLLIRALEGAPTHGKLTADIVEILWRYAQIVTDSTEGNSVDSQTFSGLVVDRYDAAKDLTKIIVPLRKFFRTFVTNQSLAKGQYRIYMQCWAQLVCLFIEVDIQGFRLIDLVGSGQYSLFDHKLPISDMTRRVWCEFLRELVNATSLENLVTPVLDIGTELLKILMLPPTDDQVQESMQLAFTLHKYNYHLLRFQAHVPEDAVKDTFGGKPAVAGLWFLEFAKEHETPYRIIKWIFESMERIVKEVSLGGVAHHRQAGEAFNIQIRDALDSVAHRLRTMPKASTSDVQVHQKYVKYLQDVIGLVKIHAHKFYSLPAFFITTSLDYWPSTSDTTMFRDGVLAHVRDWSGDKSLGTANTFLYFLLSAFDRVIETDKLLEHKDHVEFLLKDQAFFQFVVTELAKPLLRVGTESQTGWVIMGVYYQQLALAIFDKMNDIEENEEKDHQIEKSDRLFLWESTVHFLNIIAKEVEHIIAQGTLQLKDPRSGALTQQGSRILAIFLLVWQIIGPAMQGFGEGDAQQTFEVQQFDIFFNDIKILATDIKLTDNPDIAYPIKMEAMRDGIYHAGFLNIISNHVVGWTTPADGRRIFVNRNRVARAMIPLPCLSEVFPPADRCCLIRAKKTAKALMTGAARVLRKSNTGEEEVTEEATKEKVKYAYMEMVSYGTFLRPVGLV